MVDIRKVQLTNYGNTMRYITVVETIQGGFATHSFLHSLTLTCSMTPEIVLVGTAQV